MQKFNYIFFVLACLLAVGVLFISLQSANSQRSSGSDQNKLLLSKLYVAKEILPDHTFYFALMAVDRLRLELVTPEQKSSLLLAYAKRRLFYSERLLDKGQRELSFTTLSKAIKYYQQALTISIASFDEQLFSHRLNQELAFMVLEFLPYLSTFILQHKNDYSDGERVLLDLLVEQTKILVFDLQEVLYD